MTKIIQRGAEKILQEVNHKLPLGRKLIPLGEVTQPIRPRIKPSEKPMLPFIGMEHIEARTMRLLGTVPASTMKSSAVHFQPGDVLYGRLRPYLNKVYQPDFEGLCSAEFIVFPKRDNVESKYLQYFLNSWDFVSFASHLNEGDRPRVDFTQIASYPFPLAPTREQRCIVAEIEKQFSRLDEAVASLKRVKANLKRYKASVLKAAVEGKLTEQWRKEHPDVEPAEKLLEKILTERRKKWEEYELAKMKAKNIKPKDDKWKKNYKEPVAADLYELFKLPEGWIVSTLDTFCHHIGDVDHKMPKAQEHGIPYISTRDFLPNGEIDYSNAKKIRVEDYKQSCQKISPDIGDILMSRYGTIGEVRLVKSTEAFQASYSIAIIKPALKEMNNYLALVLQTDILQKQIQKYTRATAQPDLGLAHIRQLAIPLPPKIEQEVLTTEVEKRFSIMVEIKKQIDLNMRRAEHLRQSILKKAFSGKLVPRDGVDSSSDA